MQLRISLMEHTPTIWRRLLVPGEIRMAKLHIDLPGRHGLEGLPPSLLPDRRAALWHALRRGLRESTRSTRSPSPCFDVVTEPRCGSSMSTTSATRWEHEVVIEELTWSSFGLKFAVCIDGQRACPPEDCGGVRWLCRTSSRRSPTPSTRSTTTTSPGLMAPSTPTRSTWRANAALQQVR